jgi:GT2 family glycosyltransferase
VAASIDVVVPAYNRYELTRDCLSHLARQTAPHRTIVVDDGSSDDTPAQVRRDWPDVAVVELGANHGYTRAVNRGVSAGEGEYVVLLNNDVQLRPDCLERLVVPLADDPRVGSVAATILTRDERTLDSVGVTADATLAGFARLQGRPRADATLPSPVLTGPEGAAGAYRRTAWEEGGGLDETIVAYMEILDLALRLHTLGWNTASAPDALGVHFGSSTYGKRSPEQRRLAGFSRGYLLRRYGVLRGAESARALLTETAVVAGDIAICHDIEALRGRVQGWREAAGMSRHPRPPKAAIADSISLWESLRLRRAALRTM